MTSQAPTRLDVATAAVRLGMAEQSVRKAIARGTLAAVVERGPKGRKYMVPVSEVDRYKREHRTPRRGA